MDFLQSVISGLTIGNKLLTFFFYILHFRNLIDRVTKLNIGCSHFGINLNLLAYADDIVILAPSWVGLQSLSSMYFSTLLAEYLCSLITKITVSMVFNPNNLQKVVCHTFPVFNLTDCNLSFVWNFKYPRHVIDICLNDDSDIMREVKNLLMRSNLLCHRFRRRSLQVKLVLLRSCCICFYDYALWSNFPADAFLKFKSSYNQCLK